MPPVFLHKTIGVAFYEIICVEKFKECSRF